MRLRQRRGGARSDEFFVPRAEAAVPRTLWQAAEHALLLIVAFFSLAPFYAMLVTSLKTTSEFGESLGSFAPPSDPTLSKFVTAWTDLGFSNLVANSLIFSLVSAVVTTAVAALGGFALARSEFPGRRPLLIALIALMAVPAIVVVMPLFRLMVALGIVNTYPSAIVVEIGLLVPFATYLTYTFISEIPPQLFHAAAVDGAWTTRQLFAIALPLARPVLATVALISVIFAWNDLLVPLIFWQSEELRVLMVGLAGLAPGRAGGVDLPLVMAGVAISVVPIVLLFVLAKRFFIRGLVEGALK